MLLPLPLALLSVIDITHIWGIKRSSVTDIILFIHLLICACH